MSKKITIEESSGNVFLDIGFSKEEAERELLRVDLAFKIYNLLEEQKLTPVKAQAQFGLDPSDVSRIQGGEFEDFSVEHLFTILNKLNRDVEIRITHSEGTGGHLRVIAM